MAGTLTANFLEQMRRANIEPVVHVNISVTSPSALSVDFHNSSVPLVASVLTNMGDPILKNIAAVNQSVDPVKRTTNYGTIEVEVLDDGYIRSLVSSHNFYNAVTQISVGTVDLAASDYAVIYTGVVDCVWGEPGSILFKIKEFPTKTSNYSSLRTMHNEHPLTVMLQILQDVGISSSYIDSTTFQPASFSDISHLCFTSYGNLNYVDDNTSPSDLPGLWGDHDERSINSEDYMFSPGNGTFGLCATKLLPNKFIDEFNMLNQCMMITGSSGKIKITKADHTAAVTRHFTVDEYSDFEQEDDPLIYNKIVITMGGGSETQELELKDATSITAYGEKVLKVSAAYFVPSVGISENLAESFTTSSIQVAGVPVDGFTGTRNLFDASQVTADKVSASLPAYFLYRREVLKSTSPAVDVHTGNNGYAIPIWDTLGLTPSLTTGSLIHARYDGITRAFGGAQPDHEDYTANLTDVTQCYNFSEEILRRFSNTAPKIKFTVGLDNCDLELGDTFSIDNDWFISPELGLSGLNSDTKFEITKRDIQPLGDQIGVVLEAVYLTTASVPGTSVSIITPPKIRDSGLYPSTTYLGRTKAAMNASVFSGFTASTPSGLNVRIAAGTCTTGNRAITMQEPTDLVVPANKDSYIGIDSTSGIFCFHHETTGAAEPALFHNEIRLAKVVAASSVSSITDLREFGAVSTKQLDKLAIQAGRNLIFNAGFGIYPNSGSAPDSWETFGGSPGTDFTKDSTTVYAGRHAVKTLGTSTVVRLVSDKIPINKNCIYRASAFYQQAASFNMRLFVFWWKADRTAASTSSTTVFNANLSSTGAWQSITGVVEPPSDAAFASLDLNSANTGVSYFNNADLELEPYSFSAKRTGSDFTSGTSGDPIVFNTELHDYGSKYNAGTGQFTVPKSGTYTFSANVSFTGTSGARDVEVRIITNTGVLAAADLNQRVNGTSSENDVTVSVNVASAALEAGATVEVEVIWTNAAPVVKQDFSFFSGREIL